MARPLSCRSAGKGGHGRHSARGQPQPGARRSRQQANSSPGPVRSVGRKIVELEDQLEQLEDEILQVDLETETAKEKAINAQSLTASLTTFGDLYRMPPQRSSASSSGRALTSSCGHPSISASLCSMAPAGPYRGFSET